MANRKLAHDAAARDSEVLNILVRAQLRNECNMPVDTFKNAGFDRLDFMSVSKDQLKAMLVEAYGAGRRSNVKE